MVEATEKTYEVEGDVKQTLVAVEPFEKEGAENLSEAEARFSAALPLAPVSVSQSHSTCTIHKYINSIS